MNKPTKFMQRVKTPRCMPFPDALESGFKVEQSSDGSGGVDLQSKIMVTPWSPETRLTRLHEMMHAKITPRDKPPSQYAAEAGVPVSVIQHCEDGRVHANLERGAGIKLGKLGIQGLANSHLQMAVNGESHFLTSSLVALSRTKDYKRLLKYAKEAKKDREIALAGKVIKLIERYHKQPEITSRAAKMIMDESDMPPSGFDSGLEAIEEVIGNGAIPTRPGKEWGKMTIETPPLTNPRTLKKLGKMRRDRRDGDKLGNIARFFTDGKIFKRVKRVKGGTILGDASSSMNYELEQLQAVVDARPMATVALYSGSGGTGVLRVVAKDGRECKPDLLELSQGGNCIDGPALEWLAKQPEPRYWVSDGYVTGLTDNFNTDLIDICLKLCYKHRITRVDSIEDVPV